MSPKDKTQTDASESPSLAATSGKISNAQSYLSFNFTGREELLADLQTALVSNGRLALHGLGGIGRTQLALKYIDQHRSNYEKYGGSDPKSQPL